MNVPSRGQKKLKRMKLTEDKIPEVPPAHFTSRGSTLLWASVMSHPPVPTPALSHYDIERAKLGDKDAMKRVYSHGVRSRKREEDIKLWRLANSVEHHNNDNNDHNDHNDHDEHDEQRYV